MGLLLLVIQIIRGLINLLNSHTPLVINPLIVILSFVLCMIGIIFQVAGWYSILRVMKVQIPFWKMFRGYILTFISRYIPGTIWGYLSRSEWLKVEAQVDYSLTNTGSIFETGLIILTNLLFSNFVLLRYSQISSGWIICILWSLSLLIWEVLYIATNQKRISQSVFLPKVRLSKNSIIWWLLGNIFFVFMWSTFGISLWVLCNAAYPTLFHFTLNNFLWLFSDYNTAWLAGFFTPFVPAGLGVRELVLAELINGRNQLSFDVAEQLSIIFRLIMISSEFIWVAICLVKARRFPITVDQKTKIITKDY